MKPDCSCGLDERMVIRRAILVVLALGLVVDSPSAEMEEIWRHALFDAVSRYSFEDGLVSIGVLFPTKCPEFPS